MVRPATGRRRCSTEPNGSAPQLPVHPRPLFVRLACMDPAWCPARGIWLPGPEQFMDHARGKSARRLL
eukprot:11220944-Lingulodinium_polyedra.AAC.1